MRILAFGDSIVQGSLDTECGGWVNRLAAHAYQEAWTEGKFINTHNLGIGGETSVGLLARVKAETECRATNERVSLVLCGTNDAKWLIAEDKNLVPLSDFSDNYKEIIKYLKSCSSAVFCLGLTRVDESKANAHPENPTQFRNTDLGRYEQCIYELALSQGVNFVNISNVLSQNNVSHDGVHPTATGHQLIFERVKGELERAGIL